MVSDRSGWTVPRGRSALLVRHSWATVMVVMALAGACRHDALSRPARDARASTDGTERTYDPAPTVVAAATESSVYTDSTVLPDSTAGPDTVVAEVSDRDGIITDSNQPWWQPGPLSDYIGDGDASDGFSRTVLDRRRGANGRQYLLVRSVSPSREDRTIAHCGSGEEVYIRWLAVNSKGQVVREASVPVESCLMGHYLEADSVPTTGEPWRLRFRMPEDTFATVEYDRRRPQRGIRLIKVWNPNWWR